MTRFRLSCHTLEIEMGRHHCPPIPAEERLCDTCEVLEDEFHFLFHCQKYIKERQELLKPWYIPQYKNDKEKARNIFLHDNESNPHTLRTLVKFLTETLFHK